jgi:regulator of replication initiation timing
MPEIDELQAAIAAKDAEIAGLKAKADTLNQNVTALAMENVKLKQELKRRGG